MDYEAALILVRLKYHQLSLNERRAAILVKARAARRRVKPKQKRPLTEKGKKMLRTKEFNRKKKIG
jgi:hypothetical protein